MQVKTKVVTALPDSASDELRAYTVERVLETVLRDWHENGNKDGLSNDDLKDLASFVQMSVALAGKQLEAQGKPIFKATLEGLLDDWFYNWNVDGGSGPPSMGR